MFAGGVRSPFPAKTWDIDGKEGVFELTEAPPGRALLVVRAGGGFRGGDAHYPSESESDWRPFGRPTAQQVGAASGQGLDTVTAALPQGVAGGGLRADRGARMPAPLSAPFAEGSGSPFVTRCRTLPALGDLECSPLAPTNAWAGWPIPKRSAQSNTMCNSVQSYSESWPLDLEEPGR